jgi:hypothetical protein
MNAKRILLAFLALTICALFAAAAFAEEAKTKPESAKVKNIRKILELTRTRELQLQLLRRLAGELKKMTPDAPASLWDDFIEEASKGDTLIEIIIPIYDKYLDEKDIQDLLAFYESRTGKKLISVLPQITADSATAGINWGQKLGEEMMQRYQQQQQKKQQEDQSPQPAAQEDKLF